MNSHGLEKEIYMAITILYASMHLILLTTRMAKRPGQAATRFRSGRLAVDGSVSGSRSIFVAGIKNVEEVFGTSQGTQTRCPSSGS